MLTLMHISVHHHTYIYMPQEKNEKEKGKPLKSSRLPCRGCTMHYINYDRCDSRPLCFIDNKKIAGIIKYVTDHLL